MSHSEDIPAASCRRTTAWRRSGHLCAVVALAASWMAIAAPGAPGPESNATPTTSSRSSSTDRKLLWEAQEALFVNSNPADARQKAAAVLQSVATGDVETRVEALFVEMEAAAVEADDAGVTNAALLLCKLTAGMRDDPRVKIAALRLANRNNITRPLRELAQNPKLLASLASPESGASSQAAPAPEAQHPPTCPTIRASAKFFSRHARYENPAEVSQILGPCAPDLLALAAYRDAGALALLAARDFFLGR
jgi:hypothetical protein